MFFKHFLSKIQLPGLSIRGTLVENGLIVGEIKSIAVFQRYPVKKVFLEMSQNSQESTCARVSFLTIRPEACNFIKKEALAQVFFCELYEISKNTFFTAHLWTTESVGYAPVAQPH